MTLLAAALLAGTGFGQLAPPATKAPTDADGVPLPDGAIARLGSSRFRHPGYLSCPIAFSPDGRQLAAAGHFGVSVFDVASGRSVLRLPPPDDRYPWVVRFLADGKRLAVGYRGRGMGQLTVFGLTDGKAVSSAKFPGKNDVRVIDVSPDGSRALVADWFAKVYLWDVAAGREVWAFEHTEAMFVLPFTADSKRFVVAVGRKAELRDAATGRVVGSFPKPGPGFDALYRAVMAPDGRLAVEATGASAVAVLAADGATGVRTLPAHIGTERLFFSRDGRYLVGSAQAGTQVWDLSRADDKGPVARLPTASGGAFAPDGKTLALADEGYLTLWTVDDWKQLPQSADPPSPVYRVRFTPDGRRVVGHTRGGWVTWPAGGGPAARVSDDSPVYTEGLPDVSADGRVALDVVHEPGHGAGWDGLRGGGKYALRVTDLVTGKDRRIPLDSSPWSPVQISPDGRIASAFMANAEFVAWDTGTGAVLYRRTRPAGSTLIAATPAPDGKGLLRSAVGALAGPVQLPGGGPMYSSVTITNHLTGRAWRMEPMPWSVFSGGVKFSRDGSKVVVHGRWGEGTKESVTAWDVRTGRRLMARDRDGGWVEATSLSPDDRSLLVGDGRGKLALFEVATGGERVVFRHTGQVRTSAFSPDGSKAVASSPDAPVYVWDLLGDPGKWDASKADAVWADLAADNATTAFAAIRKLRANPTEAMTFLADRVKLLAAPADDAVAALLKRLDGPRFADREKAQKELADVAELVRPRLGAARKAVSEEAGRRLDQVVKSTEGLTPERLRHIRACEVLEGIGTPEAMRVLRSWAAGPEGARRTQEARESLGRLKP